MRTWERGEGARLKDGTRVTIASIPLSQADAPGEYEYEVDGPAGRMPMPVNARDLLEDGLGLGV